MFEDALEKRLKELDGNLVCCSKDELLFRERQKDGKMEVVLKLSKPCIMFRDLDEHCLSYFKSKKTADCIVFEQKDLESWVLHIFEMKRKVKLKEWKKIHEQFKGAYYNALSLAGYLGIESLLKETKLYTCFQAETISKELLAVKSVLNSGNSLQDNQHNDSGVLVREWMKGRVRLACYDTFEFEMSKISGNEDEQGQVKMTYDLL